MLLLFLSANSLFLENESSNSKLDEEVEVGSIHNEAAYHGALSIVACVLWQSIGAVCVPFSSGNSFEVKVDAASNDRGAYKHLRDLHDCDEDGVEPFGPDLCLLGEKVEIHDHVNCVVHGCEVDARR